MHRASSFSSRVEKQLTTKDTGDGKRGLFYVKFPKPGDYMVCETSPPPGTQLADPACMKVSLQLGVPEYLGLFNSKPI